MASLTVQHDKSCTIPSLTGTITDFNSSGGTATVMATDLVRPDDWNSVHDVTLALQGSDLSAQLQFTNGLTSSTNTAGVTVGMGSANYYEPFALPNTNSTLSAPANGSWYIEPFNNDNYISGGRINFPVSNAAGFIEGTTFSAATTGSVSRYQTIYENLAIYSRNAGTNSSQLSLYWSNSAQFQATWVMAVSSTATNAAYMTNSLSLSYPINYDISGGSTYTTTSQSGSTSTGSSTLASSFMDSYINTAKAYLSGARLDAIGFNTTLAPGQYWIAHMIFSTSSSTGTNYGQGVIFSTHSVLGLLENNIQAYKKPGSSVSSSSGTGPVPYHGYLATTSSGASASILASNIIATTGRLYWNWQQESYP